MKGPAAGIRRGFTDALPICFGYAAVGFAVAAAAVANGHPAWAPILQSITHLSGTSQGAIARQPIPAPQGAFWSLALLCLGLNARYLLLSLALAQKLPPGIGFAKRAVIAAAVTDENVALCVSRPFAPSFRYVLGVLASSGLGWTGGNALGAVGTSLLPPSAVAPLGIALYAMFVAIVVSAAKGSFPLLLCVALAAVTNTVLVSFVPAAAAAPALSVLASGVAAAALSAIAFPKEEQGT